MIWPQGGEYMGLNVHVMCKYICNRAGLVVKGPRVQVWIGIYGDHVFIIVEMWIVMYECIWLCGGGSPIL